MNYAKRLAPLLLCFCLQPRADGLDIIGYVKTVSGEAWLANNGDRQKAEVGSPLHAGEMLETGEGSLGVTLKDDTQVSIGADTRVAVEEFIYEPARHELKLTVHLLKGVLQYISGIIAKLKPEAVTVQTPTAFIGVRGTRFLVKVEE